jgi:hypothetical protein
MNPNTDPIKTLDLLQEETNRLRRENEQLRDRLRVRMHNPVVRKNGMRRSEWGSIKDIVLAHQNLPAPTIVKRWGVDRFAVYAAARRLCIKLPTPKQYREQFNAPK